MYKLSRSPDMVIRIADGASIPLDARNRDYQEYLAWGSKGNTATPADAAPPPPQDEIDAVAAKAYAKLTALRGMTPGQVQTWVDGNVTDLNSAKDAIKTLAIAVSILARRI